MRIDQVLDGRYRLLDKLGAGGMSVVWRARDEVLDRHVAVKVIAGSYADSEARVQLRSEARATARLRHPNVTDIYDYGEWSDGTGVVAYVVMELLGGQTLSQRLRLGPLPPREGLRICAEVAAALAAAHAAGLVHRDVKPSNVMLTPDGAKVFDFGIAAAIGSGELDVHGDLLGTPAYLAPERLTGGDVVPASDVYALGLLMHRVFTTHLPWTADTITQMVQNHVYEAPAPLPPTNGLPPSVNALCDRCLKKDPGDRPKAGEVATALSAALGGASAGSSSRRRRLIVGGTAAAALAVVVAAALTREESPEDEPVGAPLTPASSAAPAASGPPATASRAPSATPPRTREATTPPAADPTAADPPAADPPAADPPAADPPAAAAPEAAAPAGSPVRAKGGTIRIRCSGSSTTVLAVDPAAGYEIKDHDPGPADEVQVVLISARNESEIKVKCSGGSPVPQIKESPQ